MYALGGFAAVRANLLRAQGFGSNDSGLLVSIVRRSTRSQDVDTDTRSRRARESLRNRDSAVLRVRDIEVNLGLACADRAYMQTLANRLAGADLWCDRVAPNQCQLREALRKDMVAVLRYGLAVSEPTNARRAPAPRLPSDSHIRGLGAGEMGSR